MVRARAILINFALAFSLSGCGSPGDTSHVIASENREFGQALNNMLLLNIARASFDHPMVFSVIDNVANTNYFGFSANFSIPFGGASTPSYLFTPGFDVRNSSVVTARPTFDQEFYYGFLKPNSLETVDLFMQQAIPRDLIWNLFIDRIDVIQGQNVYSFFNNPRSYVPASASPAARMADYLDYENLRQDSILTVSQLIHLRHQGYDDYRQFRLLLATLLRYGLYTRSQLTTGAGSRDHTTSVHVAYCLCQQYGGIGTVNDEQSEFAIRQPTRADSSDPGPSSTTSEIVIYLRSTASVFRYLGAIATATRNFEISGVSDNPFVVVRMCEITDGPDCPVGERKIRRIFSISTHHPVTDPFVSIEYGGFEHFVPAVDNNDPHYSALVLTILSYLYGTNLRASASPATVILTGVR